MPEVQDTDDMDQDEGDNDQDDDDTNSPILELLEEEKDEPASKQQIPDDDASLDKPTASIIPLGYNPQTGEIFQNQMSDPDIQTLVHNEDL